MSNRDRAAAQPGGVSTVPPATPVRFWSSTDTDDAPPPTVTWAGRSDVAAGHADQAVEHRPVADPQPVMLVLAGHPGPQATDGLGGLHRELAVHVHVRVRDGGPHRHPLAPTPPRVAQPRPALPAP